MDLKRKKLIISKQASIRNVMDLLNEIPLGIVVLAEEDQTIAGVVTDGDIRRALLSGAGLDSPIRNIMNTQPVFALKSDTDQRVLRLFNDRIKQIPILDENRRVIDLLLYADFSSGIYSQKSDIVVRAKVPLRISFCGGGTDFDSYIEAKGGVVLSTTINKYCYGTLLKRSDQKIIIHSRDYQKRIEIPHYEAIEYDGNLDLLKAVIRLMKPSFGMELFFESEVPPGTGLGSSSAVAVCAAGLLNYLREDKLDDYQLAQIAFQAERIELKVSGGWQDQYACIFGGINFIEFKYADTFVHPLKIKDEILNELESSLLLCFTGLTRESGEIVKNQSSEYAKGDPIISAALDQTKEMAIRMKELLLKGEVRSLGKLLDEAWQTKKKLNSKITNAVVDRLYDVGLKHGALGGKILGAGNGGYILFFCPPLLKQEIAEALIAEKAQIMNFNLDLKGLQTWAVKS